METVKITKSLRQKISQFNALIGNKKEHEKQVLMLQKEINDLIEKQPNFPHKGDSVWCWYGGIWCYTQNLHNGTVDRVVWRQNLQCFKVCVRIGGGTRVWRTLDEVWSTEKEAKRWMLLKEIKIAERNLDAAHKRLFDLIKQAKDMD